MKNWRHTLRRLARSHTLLRAAHYGCTLLGLYAIAFTYISLSQFTHEKRLREVERLLVIGILDAESGQRAYLLTDDTLFLVQYQAGLKALELYEPVYRAALASREGRQLYETVSNLLKLKKVEMQLSIRTHDEAGSAQAALIVRSRMGHNYTGEIYELLGRIQAVEAQTAVPLELWKAPRELDIHDGDRAVSPSEMLMGLRCR